MSSDSEVQVKFTADVKGLLEGLKAGQEHLETATSAMKGDLGSMIESFEHFGATALLIGGVGLAFEGLKESVEWVGEAIEKTNSLARSFEGLAFQTGSTLEELNGYNSAMVLTGGNVGELEGWMKSASRAMKSNSEMLVENGIAANSAALMAMPFPEYLKKVMEVLESVEEPGKRAILAQEMLGRAGLSATPQIRRFLETLERDGVNSLSAYGAHIDEDGIKRMQEFERASGSLTLQQDAMWADMAASSAPWALALQNMKLGWVELLNAMMGGHATFKQALADITGIGEGSQEKALREQAKALNVKIMLQEDYAPTGPTAGMQVSGSSTYKEPVEKKEGGPKTAEEIAAAKAAVEEAKKAAEAAKKAADDRRKYNDDLEQNMVGLNKKRLEMEKANDDYIENLELKLAQESAGIAKARAASQISASRSVLAQTKQDLEDGVAQGKISAEQELAARKSILDQETALERHTLEEEMEILKQDGLQHIAETIKVQSQISAIEAKARLEKSKLEHAYQTSVFTGQKAVLDGMTNGWEAGLQKMAHGTLKFSDGIKGALLGVGDYFEKMVLKMGLDWLKGEILKSAATQAGATVRVATEEEAALKSVALWLWAGLKNIAIKGWEAAAGAYAAIVSIPYVGPVLAPIAAAGALAAVIGISSHLASASGGWDQVPSDQLAMIHKNEMVLPAPLAERVRQMASGGEGGSGGGGGATGGGHTIHIHANDAASFAQMLNQPEHSAALTKWVGTRFRDGRIK